MLLIIGWVVVIIVVFGGFMVSGGHLAVLVHPVKLLMIVGAGVGAFVASCSPGALKSVIKLLPSAFKGPKYTKALYTELLCLLYELLNKMRRDGLMSLEDMVDKPEDSALFKKYPTLLAERHVIEFLCDYLRMMITGSMDPNELETLMDQELDTHHQETEVPLSLLNKLGDSMPAFGIVAAVMGVVLTMSSLHLPAEELGPMIGAALVGAFVGILFGYAIIAPIPAALEHKIRDEAKALEAIKVTLLATLHHAAPSVAVEHGRKVLFSADRPSFQELSESIRAAR
ncbi:flagellar motor stator protein MotA [Wenzhouxiangella sp. XN24]|uniref:flagellar motor stator protein MotA n=1 Tax=Wenzhouxiangella sp. XN24 TaxID=2713569 RepID=UPI0013EB3267|nr:flagellar motor stator protein MotA [Wenzhouxiangella sp. XN24]NGX17166.1 flagellar motor stator protein MotA [Wenzhouxiangella sp. XN24]